MTPWRSTRDRTHSRRFARAGPAEATASCQTRLRSAAMWYVRFKTATEWLASLALLIVATPVLLSLAVLLKCTSRGPVFYLQTRLGRHGRHFTIIKFRSMADDCEASTGPVWSIVGDPRVTKVGRWLRDTHLDELPQLWNVLRGEMSLIGPRPERPSIAAKIERFMPEFRERLLVRPGITGLAQMQLPADSDLHAVRRKLDHDLQYIRHIGPGLDALITLSTVLHFVAMAATSASRQFVQPFAPPRPAQPPAWAEGADGAEPGLLVAGHRIGDLYEVKDEGSIAA